MGCGDEKADREAAEQHWQQVETLQYKLDDAEQRLADGVSRYAADLREVKSEYNATVSERKYSTCSGKRAC